MIYSLPILAFDVNMNNFRSRVLKQMFILQAKQLAHLHIFTFANLLP